MDPPTAIRHLAFEPRRGVALADATLSDRERLAILFQASAVLAHLESVGWRLSAALDEAQVDLQALLVLPAPLPGTSLETPQQSLLRLVARLFGDEKVPGRGEARRVVKRLSRRLRQTLTPVPAESCLAELLAEAPFLWSAAFAGARRALVAERVRGESKAATTTPWVAGPGVFRRRVLELAANRAELESLLASERARGLWLSQSEGSAKELFAAGRFAAAVAAWEIEPPREERDRLDWARALAALGRSERALEALATLTQPEARRLRVSCQLELGRLTAAHGTLRQLEGAPLGPAATLELAEVAVKLLANLGRLDELEVWVERARKAAGRGPLASRARLLAAVAAWDRGDTSRAASHLEASRAALEEPDLAWRWRKAAALVAQSTGDVEVARRLLAEALAGGRRRLSRREAGELWNELGVCRAAEGDLAGAERAFLHTSRLWAGLEGPRSTTLALFNLAEIRLRRGRLRGVRELLEEVTLENRLGANLRGSVQDLELWARYELAFGRFASALEHTRRALRLLAGQKLSFREDVVRLLAARALAWLGRAEEAASELEQGGQRALGELEPEERPALLALAGRRDQALLAALSTPWPAVWQDLLLRGELSAQHWREVEVLEPFRRARLVFDAAMLAPGGVSAELKVWAARVFRSQSATLLAERLEDEGQNLWREMAAYLEGKPDGSSLLVQLARIEPALRIESLGRAGRLPTLDSPGEGERLAPETSRAAAMADREGRVRRELGGMVGESPKLMAAVDRLQKLAPSELPVLILGESGTGKELAARLVHEASPRARQPFVAMNCAAVAENLLLADLFGHVRGAFTGAERDRAGVFETAQGGTVFLDEIGDLPLSAQGMLLRVLQESEVRRVGESLARKVKARVVAATHRDLAAMVAAGSFRNDLFFRLKVASVVLPPLAQRMEDVPRLAEHFLARTRPGLRRAELSPAALAALCRYRWPGNVRELENVLKVAVELAASENSRIEPHHLELPEKVESNEAENGIRDYHRLVDAFRIRLVTEALAAANGNRAEAARRLKLTRQAFSYLVRSLRIP